jgi:hypothetical protein
MNRYYAYALTFIINAAILATISSISIETRLAIDKAPNTHISSVSTLFDKFFFNLRMMPYKFANIFGFSKNNIIPEWIKFLFTFLITFFIAILVYHIFLLILGYKKMYKYFFGNIDYVWKK